MCRSLFAPNAVFFRHFATRWTRNVKVARNQISSESLPPTEELFRFDARELSKRMGETDTGGSTIEASSAATRRRILMYRFESIFAIKIRLLFSP